ncbi:hypothetical protein C1646_756847 [Rhizophagus diaphanus]|nr:hypothetical protein C1646_756847 [Rhizophagus diaphanus] [Rhizophagus sp. MUCL 43196]
MLAKYFAWNGDILSPLCTHCDNCLRVQAELAYKVDVKTDAIKMPNPNGNTLQTNIHIFCVVEDVTAIVIEKNWKIWLRRSQR